MAELDEKSWKDHQHVIMAINIKSMYDFEPVANATPVFYGSTIPFIIPELREPGQQITITGTNVKTYMARDNIKINTPILLVTRVRDIEKDDIDDLDKRYLVCSNVEFNGVTITITTTTNDKGWKGLNELIVHIFDRQKDYNVRLDKLLKRARDSVKGLIHPQADEVAVAAAVAAAVKPNLNQVVRVEAPNVPKLTRPNYKEVSPKGVPIFDSADAYYKSNGYKKWEKDLLHEKEGKARSEAINERSKFKGNVNNYFSKIAKNNKTQDTSKAGHPRNGAGRTHKGGGSPNDDLKSLIDLVSNTEHGFKKYVYFLLMQPFYFKLNALTPKLLTIIKSYKLTDDKTSVNATFDAHILQPFVKFSYVEYIDKKPAKNDDLAKNLSGLIAHSKTTDIISNFATQIEKDTKNYNELITNGNQQIYYIHIFRFIELIEKQIETTQSQYPPDKSTLPEHVTVFIRHAIKKIHEHMQQVIPLFELLTPIDKILIRDDTKTPPQKRLQVYIDDYVSSQNRTDVITYLKINNTEPKELRVEKSWNQRYDIRLKQANLAGESHYKFNAMILRYKIAHQPFYKQITYGAEQKKAIAAVDGLEEIVTYKRAGTESKEIDAIKNYDKYYLFGNYENIFPLYNIDGKKETNRENATHMTAIIEQICTKNKPVFLLGYGASGSGKTSSLIYFNKGDTEDEKNGIVIELCKEIINNLNATHEQVKSVKVVVKEFYMTTGLQTNTSAEYVFTTDLNIINGNIGQSKHAYHVNMNKPADELKTMGQVLKQLVDVDRYVKATTNNPQSSRSHVLVFIQFCSDDAGNVPIRNLIIGDFAGKENAFQCAEIDTIVSFLNTKIENPESKYPGYPFYSAQIKGGDGNYENDPTDIIQKERALHMTRKYISPNVATQSVYNFEKPFESGHFIKPDIIQNQEQEEKYIISAMNYQLKRLLIAKIEENGANNKEIYEQLLGIVKDRYSQLMLPDNSEYVKLRGMRMLPSIHPGIGLIDKYSLVRTEKTDDASIDTMIKNMCEDFNTTMEKKDNLSCKDVLYLSYLTDTYVRNYSDYEFDNMVKLIDHMNNLLNNIVGKTVKINVDDYKENGSYIYEACLIILKTTLLIYVYSNTDVKKREDVVNAYINNIEFTFTSRMTPEEITNMKEEKITPTVIYSRNDALYKETIKKLGEGSGDYTLADAVKMVQDIYHKLSPRDVQFKYYRKDEHILNNKERPAKITEIKFDVPDLTNLASSRIEFTIDGQNQYALLVPEDYGFPVLAGEENGHTQLLKRLILEELFEVKSCNTTTQPTFTELHPGKTLTKKDILTSVLAERELGQSADVTDKKVSKQLAENENQMASIGRAGITFVFPPNSGKTSVKDYKFVDAIYSDIIQHAKPIDAHVTKPSDYDTFFVSTINNMIKYIKNPTNAYIFNTTYTSPFLCSQITDVVIGQLLTKFPTDNKTKADGTEYSIVVTDPTKIPTYTDKFDNNPIPKPIPIVKTFTIESLSAHIMTTRFDFLFPFFEIKGGAYCEPSAKAATGCMHNYVNELKYILDSLSVKFDANHSPIVDDIHKYLAYINQSRNIITETMVRLQHGKQVCENRLIEGKYINSSLDKIRQAIKYILNKKHEDSDAVFHSPDFIDICLQSYCPSGINCFNTSSSDNAPESLIDEIYKHIRPKAEDKDKDKDKDKFYKDLVISVFGVFNVSRLADNPPSVPYIDINHLKQIYYNKGSYYSNEYPILWTLHELNKVIQKLPEQNIKMLPLIEYVSEDPPKNLPLITALTKLIDVAKNDYKDHKDEKNILSIARESISDNFMNTLKRIIEAIDIHNAASTIGTLEFLDQLSKFNSVNNLCYKNTEDNSTPYLDDNDYKEYETNANPI